MSAYTDSLLDNALAQATPVYPAAHGGAAPKLTEGQHCYLLAQDGLYVAGRGRGFTAFIRLCALPKLTPFGELREGVVFDDAMIPRDLTAKAAVMAIADSPLEWAGAIVRIDAQYALQSVRIGSASPAHVTYDRDSYDDAALVVDMHSHGDSKPYFSSIDNASDAEGVHLSLVFGHCATRESLRLVARVSINGHFLHLDERDWLEPKRSDQ